MPDIIRKTISMSEATWTAVSQYRGLAGFSSEGAAIEALLSMVIHEEVKRMAGALLAAQSKGGGCG